MRADQLRGWPPSFLTVAEWGLFRFNTMDREKHSFPGDREQFGHGARLSDFPWKHLLEKFLCAAFIFGSNRCEKIMSESLKGLEFVGCHK